jgi:hypothetical protein
MSAHLPSSSSPSASPSSSPVEPDPFAWMETGDLATHGRPRVSYLPIWILGGGLGGAILIVGLLLCTMSWAMEP